MTNFVERRTNSHVQMLVEAGVRLCRAYGHEYARSFLKDVNVPESIVECVLEAEPRPPAAKRIRHVTYQHLAPVQQEISADH